MTIRFDRLQRLAHILNDLTPGQVELDNWQSRCGTTACALGWACTDPEFIREGLSFTKQGRPYFDNGVEGALADDRHFYCSEAGAEFFGLGEGNGGVLFGLRLFSEYDEGFGFMSDRDLAIHRIRRLFEDNGRDLEL